MDEATLGAKIGAAVDAWFNSEIHGSQVSRSTEAWQAAENTTMAALLRPVRVLTYWQYAADPSGPCALPSRVLSSLQRGSPRQAGARRRRRPRRPEEM